MTLQEMASGIYNDLVGGAIVPKSNIQFISIEQLEDECIAERDAVMREWYLKGLLQPKDMMYALNCVEVDCEDQNKCPCNSSLENAKMAKHFEIPQLAPGLGADAVSFIGSTDRDTRFNVYYSLEATKYQKYRRRKSNKPYVYIEKTPNKNNKYDCWIFNAPFVKYIAVIAVFKDPRVLQEYSCCASTTDYLEMGAISDEVKNRIINKKIRLYRAPVTPSPQAVL